MQFGVSGIEINLLPGFCSWYPTYHAPKKNRSYVSHVVAFEINKAWPLSRPSLCNY